MTKEKLNRKGNQMKKLFFVLYSVLFLVGCGDMPGLAFSPHKNLISECPDHKAINFNIFDCSLVDGVVDINDCPWETNEDCEYCEDLYDTEEERWENCCNVSGAVNSTWSWGDDNWSKDSTYCIFE